jgi:ABC-type nitrate/sulfonate/bicarbonate transport system substrate-binding protein
MIQKTLDDREIKIKRCFEKIVPEHFSTPLYIARDNGYFKESGVDVELVLCPGKKK